MKRYPKGTWMKLRSPEILQAFMRQKDFSMSRLARYAGCSKSMVSHLSSGRKSSCTPELATRISEALDVPREALFDLRPSADSGRSDRTERIAS